MIDAIAAAIGLVWNGGVLLGLRRLRDPSRAILVLGFYALSLYTIDRVLPTVLVDGWTNFDAARTPALRPWVILPDLLLVGVLALVLRRVSRPAAIVVGGMALATAVGLVQGLANPAVPASAAAFWAIVPLRGIGIVLVVDHAIRAVGWEGAFRIVTRVALAGAAFIALQILVVVLAKAVAAALGHDLAAVWSGFDWVRPNLPGWNNNIAASAVAVGGVAALAAPGAIGLRWRWLAPIVAVLGLAILLTEYRTAILLLIAAVGGRVAVEAGRRAAPSLAPAGRAALGALAGGGVALVLLVAAAVAVPRLGDLNPLTYVAQVGGPTLPGEPTPTPEPTPEPGEDTSNASRGQILRAALSVWQRDPVVGAGLGAWEFARPTEPSFLQRQITTHNGYAWTLADLGVVGLVGLYLLPIGLALATRPPLPAIVLLAAVLFLEVATVGIGHSRYAVTVWSVLAVVALAGRRRGAPDAPGP